MRSLRKNIAIDWCWTPPTAAEGRGILTNSYRNRVPTGSSHAQHLPCVRPQLRVCSTPQSSTPKWVPWSWVGLNLHQKTEMFIHSQKTQKVCNERHPVEDAAREARNCWVQKDKTKPGVVWETDLSNLLMSISAVPGPSGYWQGLGDMVCLGKGRWNGLLRIKHWVWQWPKHSGTLCENRQNFKDCHSHWLSLFTSINSLIT